MFVASAISCGAQRTPSEVDVHGIKGLRKFAVCVCVLTLWFDEEAPKPFYSAAKKAAHTQHFECNKTRTIELLGAWSLGEPVVV